MQCVRLTLRGSFVDATGKGTAVAATIVVAFLSVMPLLVVALPVSANGGVADAYRLPEFDLMPEAGYEIPEPLVHADMTIELLPSACSGGPQILLGEIAVVHVEDEALRKELCSVEVGSAPLPGSSRKINLGQVQVRMRARKINPGKFVFAGAYEVTVAAAARRISAQDLEAAAIDSVCASTGHALSPSDFRVARTDAPQGLLVPPGEVSLEAQVAQTGADMAFVRVRVRAMVDGTEARSVLVWLEITAPPVVMQLGAVTLVVEAGDVRISVPAVALQDGRPGQRIRVRNAVTGIVVQARVLDSQTVRAHAGDMEGSP